MAFLKAFKDGTLTSIKAEKIRRGFLKIDDISQLGLVSHNEITLEMVLTEIEKAIKYKMDKYAEKSALIVNGIKQIEYSSIFGYAADLLDQTLTDPAILEPLKRTFYVFFKSLEGLQGNVDTEWNTVTLEQIITAVENGIRPLVRLVDEDDAEINGTTKTVTYTTLDE
jgi:hypothetical protein